MYDEVPEPLSETEKKNWISSLQAVAVSSDAFFPFRDNIDRAKRVNISHLSVRCVCHTVAWEWPANIHCNVFAHRQVS